MAFDIIRVFPRKTKWTPTDDLAFVGSPPLFDIPKLPIYISVCFTWDISKASILHKEWSAKMGTDVRIGGPAFGDPGGEFNPGVFIRKGVVITSRGCPKRCPWCYVPEREGLIRELEIRDGWVVQDNNLLACSKSHIKKVFDMLGRQPIPASFPGGLDINYLNEWHIKLLSRILVAMIFVAFDTRDSLKNLDKVSDLLSDYHRDQKRAYVLIGYKGDDLDNARTRLEQVYEAGFLPYAMLWDGNSLDRSWRKLKKIWSRPAIYKSIMKKKES